MAWFKKNNETPAPALIKFSGRKLLERLRPKNAKWYVADIVLMKGGKEIGTFSMTIQAFSKDHLQQKLKEEVTLHAKNIHLKKK